MTMISFHRGAIGPTHDIGLLGIDDVLGTLRGYRIFTTLRTVGGNPLELEAHLDRLTHAAQSIHMSIGDAVSQLREAVPPLLQANHCDQQDVVMQFFLSGGGTQGSGMAANDEAWPSILVREYHPVPDHLLQSGFKLASMAHNRAFAPIKFTFYAASVMAHHTVVKQHHADDVLFISEGDNPVVLEGSTFNIMVVINGKLMTPRADGRILSGITRRRILEWGNVEEGDLAWADRARWDEMVLCSSVRGVVGVTMIDGERVGDGKVGPVTLQLMGQHQRVLQRCAGKGA